MLIPTPPGISNWVEGKRLPGHGNATDHIPELVLNGFRTPLGLLVAHLFRTLFPPIPELQGRQVVTAREYPISICSSSKSLASLLHLPDSSQISISPRSMKGRHAKTGTN